MAHPGSCLCGALRFQATEDPVDTGYCHCRMCQRLSGAAALPWASFRTQDFSYTEGEPRVYRSSQHGQRRIRAACGSQIAFRSLREDTVEINVGTLLYPDAVVPLYHIWCESRISWFDTDDDLPRYPRSKHED